MALIFAGSLSIQMANSLPWGMESKDLKLSSRSCCLLFNGATWQCWMNSNLSTSSTSREHQLLIPCDCKCNILHLAVAADSHIASDCPIAALCDDHCRHPYGEHLGSWCLVEHPCWVAADWIGTCFTIRFVYSDECWEELLLSQFNVSSQLRTG